MTVLAAFRDDEGAFTTVAVAVALLLSVTLVFAAASASWVSSRSSEVQRVADATALAGANSVAAYATIAQGPGRLRAQPGAGGDGGVRGRARGVVRPGPHGSGLQMCQTGGRILEVRRSFASSAARGLEGLEAVLPMLVVANSASCAAANSEDGSPTWAAPCRFR